jgi:hypothetical protein
MDHVGMLWVVGVLLWVWNEMFGWEVAIVVSGEGREDGGDVGRWWGSQHAAHDALDGPGSDVASTPKSLHHSSLTHLAFRHPKSVSLCTNNYDLKY